MDCDLLIHGGHVIDPATGRSEILDVAIVDDRISAVDRGIGANARHRVDATGQIVTPGLIDLHTHVFWGSTYWGVEADPVAATTGVTTWLDVGSAGAYNFPGFRRFIVEQSRSRILSLLNLSAIGLTGPTFELSILEYCDVPLAQTIIEGNRDQIVGIKARIDRNTTRGTGIEPLNLARDLANRVQLPLMVHIGQGPPELVDIIEVMRPGDILTHCFTGHTHRIIGPDQRMLEFVRRAWDGGIILDVGHGGGSFSFEISEAMLAEGLLPDVISSDIHQSSVQGPMFDLPTTLSKFLMLGMSIEQTIDRATVKAAHAMARPDLGTLKIGSVADVAVFALDEGDFTFYDVAMVERRGRRRLRNVLTIRAGEVMDRVPMPPLQPWAPLPDEKLAILNRPGTSPRR
jgi:dihydroorotase